jgi:hypothetical protein
VESLGSYLTLHFNPASARLDNEAARCAAARNVARAIAGAAEGFVFHPYPVTPYHPDYLQHADLAEAEKARYANAPAQAQRPGPVPLRVRAKGPVAVGLVPAKWRAAGTEWDAALEEVDVGELMAARAVALNGWLGPPWLKEGWSHAFALLAETVSDGSARSAADRMAGQLRAGAYKSAEEKLNLERALVRTLARGCDRAVVGYTVKREYFNSEFSAGVENIAYDSETGLNSPLFIRTVKLKDFPWNGWLRLGVSAKPSAAWNPVAGFTDPAGRLLWFALGDPAFLPEPYGRGWGPNRVESFKSASGSE